MPDFSSLFSKLFSPENMQKVVNHFQQHKDAYTKAAKGAAVATGAVVTYKVAKSKGHTEGKKEGMAEQAKMDSEKFRQLEEEHNADREKWKNVSKEKDKLIEDLGKTVH